MPKKIRTGRHGPPGTQRVIQEWILRDLVRSKRREKRVKQEGRANCHVVTQYAGKALRL